MSELTADDLVYYTDKENNIYSGGYNVHSILMKEGINPAAFLPLPQSGDGEQQGGGSEWLKDLVVPGWIATGGSGNSGSGSGSGSILHQMQTDESPTTLYDKLLDLVADTTASKTPRTSTKITTYRRHRGRLMRDKKHSQTRKRRFSAHS